MKELALLEKINGITSSAVKIFRKGIFFKDTKSLKYNSKLSSLDEGKVLQFNKLKSHDCFLSRVNEFGQMVPEKVKPDVNYEMTDAGQI